MQRIGRVKMKYCPPQPPEQCGLRRTLFAYQVRLHVDFKWSNVDAVFFLFAFDLHVSLSNPVLLFSILLLDHPHMRSF